MTLQQLTMAVTFLAVARTTSVMTAALVTRTVHPVRCLHDQNSERPQALVLPMRRQHNPDQLVAVDLFPGSDTGHLLRLRAL